MTPLKENAILSRFIHYKKEINWDAQKVKTSLFSKGHPEGFSVFETTNLDEEEITRIEKKYIRKERSDKRSPYGRCDTEVKYYQESSLSIQSSMPPPRHYNIMGMPISNDLKDAQNLNLRQKIVANSNLFIYKFPE